MRTLIALFLLALPMASHAQAGSVSPGMTRAQVVAALGEPATARTASEYTYLFYRNNCGRACGMNDLVVLRADSVVDAIFRSPGRHYTGTSSSPTPITRAAARRGPATPARGTLKTAPPARPTTSPAPRLTPPPANDRRPSIPAGEPPVRPAPASTPASKRPPAQ